MTMGRPTRYLKRYCKDVVEFGKVGMSRCEIASGLGVSLRSVYKWQETHADFKHAMDDARQESQSWWEAQGRINLVAAPEDAKINASLYSRSMAARFPDDWREKSEVKSDVVVTELSESERSARVNAILDAGRAKRDRQVARDGQEVVDTSGGASE